LHTLGQPEILEELLQIKGNSPNLKIDERKGLGVRGVQVASIYTGEVRADRI
jgi:hypothetical protein